MRTEALSGGPRSWEESAPNRFNWAEVVALSVSGSP